jgi:hypothetical protein
MYDPAVSRGRGVLAHHVVGVEGEQVVGSAPGLLDVAGAVAAEVDPGVLTNRRPAPNSVNGGTIVT